MKIIKPQEKFMKAAIKEALKAKKKGDYAIGAVIIKDEKIIARGSNQSKIKEDPTCHAEIMAIRNAVKKLKTRHLKGCLLYTTHEPCPMCAGTAVLAMLDGVVSGASRQDMGKYRLVNGNKKYLWRNFDLSAKIVLKSGVPKVPIYEKFMHDKCKNLFHN